MTGIAKDPSPDATLALLRDGYGFVSRRCARLGAEAFRTRLMLRPVLCARGSAAAEAFYTPDRFTRVGAMPAVTMRLLQDRDSVQMLDGPAHRHRKLMFLRMLHEDDQVDRLAALTRAELVAAIPHWTLRQPVELVGAMAEVLTRVAFRWTGIPLTDPPRAVRDLTAMIRNAGRFGPRAWRALKLRDGHEREMQAVIRDIRSGALCLAEDQPARIVAEHRDPAGDLLSEAAAAVELINLTRPIVAVAWFTGFAALALAAHPDRRVAFRESEDGLDSFAEEVRRDAPFFPLIGGKAVTGFDWLGERIEPGTWMLLDLYGTTHDPARFPEPDRFDPDRQLSWRQPSRCFIPQGAGDLRETHRCPGERVTVEILKLAIAFLARDVDWRLRRPGPVPRARFPAIPRGGVVLEDFWPRRGTGFGFGRFRSPRMDREGGNRDGHLQ